MQDLQYSALERVKVSRPKDRLTHLERCAEGKRVFDLGALDETAYQAKQTTHNWLHARLCRVATSVVGIDNSALVPDEGLTTATNGVIVRENIFDLQPVVDKHGIPDLILAGELIEHLPDTSALLTSLKATPSLKGVELVVTTPNACCWHNTLVGVAGRESMHKDHLQIYSYKTLRTLFERSGFRVDEMLPYHARFPEMIEGSSRGVATTARMFQTFVNGLEIISPMLSAGWIVHARI
ncbi:methyltransferase domain-containing protein [Pseudoxanthomonas mexicana]